MLHAASNIPAATTGYAPWENSSRHPGPRANSLRKWLPAHCETDGYGRSMATSNLGSTEPVAKWLREGIGTACANGSLCPVPSFPSRGDGSFCPVPSFCSVWPTCPDAGGGSFCIPTPSCSFLIFSYSPMGIEWHHRQSESIYQVVLRQISVQYLLTACHYLAYIA